MSKRKKGPDPDSPEEMRKEIFIGAGIVTVAIILVVLGFTVIVPRFMRALTGEASFAGQPASYWTTALADNDPRKSGEAGSALRNGGASAVPVLTQLLKAEPPLARGRAARILALIGSKDAVPALTEAQKSSERDVRCWSAFALVTIVPEEGTANIPSVLEASLIQDRDLNTAERVDKALEKYPIAKLVPGLVEAAKHPTMAVRFKAVQRLEKSGPEAKEATPVLIELLRDKKTTDKEGIPIAEYAAKALKQVNPDAQTVAVQSFMKELQDKSADRAGAAYALGRLRDAAKPAVPTLQTLLKDSDGNVAEEAHRAIEAIDPSVLDPKKKPKSSAN